MGPAPAEGRWEAATPVLPHGPAPLPPLPAGADSPSVATGRALLHHRESQSRSAQPRSAGTGATPPVASRPHGRAGAAEGRRPNGEAAVSALPPRNPSAEGKESQPPPAGPAPRPAEERGGRAACVPGRRRAAGQERGRWRRGRERPDPLSRSPASPARRCPRPVVLNANGGRARLAPPARRR